MSSDLTSPLETDRLLSPDEAAEFWKQQQETLRDLAKRGVVRLEVYDGHVLISPTERAVNATVRKIETAMN